MKVLKILKKTELKIKLKKYIFHIDKIKYLKYIITNWKLQINPAKIRIIKK